MSENLLMQMNICMKSNGEITLPSAMEMSSLSLTYVKRFWLWMSDKQQEMACIHLGGRAVQEFQHHVDHKPDIFYRSSLRDVR